MASNKVPLREGIYYNSTFSCLESTAGDIHLTPNEKKILEIILDKRGRKDTIIDEIWHQKGIVVSESSYHQLVKMLRRKFTAAGLPSSCLKTIPRYGIVYVNEAVIKPECLPDTYRCLPTAIKELLPYGAGGDVITQANFFAPQYLGHSKLSSRYFTVFIIFTASLFMFALLSNTFSSNYFKQIKYLNQVNYYMAPSAQVSEAIWQRIEQHILPMTREVYVASNGPKMWVAYCEKSIYKDNAPCAYEHFSMY
ncbi:transcriptional regulator [Rouxiella sp. WC2420]|uniref:Transcriptional regulator n=1 Tax=Rouxiella sp. WC2420 TaxID=3234145 RepID=A0AB39VQ27_9GAMM